MFSVAGLKIHYVKRTKNLKKQKNIYFTKKFIYDIYFNHDVTDVDECAEQTDNCEQICINHVGHHSCDCRKGYKLNSNNYTCDGMEF